MRNFTAQLNFTAFGFSLFVEVEAHATVWKDETVGAVKFTESVDSTPRGPKDVEERPVAKPDEA